MNYEKMRKVYKGNFSQIYLRLGGDSPKPWEGIILYWVEDNKYNLLPLSRSALNDVIDKHGVGFVSKKQIKP